MKFTKQFSAIVFIAGPTAAQSTSDLYSILPIDLTASVTLPVESGGTASACPTVTEVTESCATCPVPQCLTVSTLTQSCGCPTPVLTEYVSIPCRNPCARVGCSTSYTIIPGEESCGGTGGSGTATVTASVTRSTTVAVTSTETPGTGSGAATETGSGASTSAASSSPTPNAARRLGVPFKFW
ncbi:uncharacterized protein GLRG_09600 [Colletotrichum graminicola M1.001]|uniref:Uncharacterized protein n=1 Tax=Colletotrichum graminicola (strain M1.001 / M2 / FGSC 10212) TaxID=645133 RepID=E3QUB8_COLGM|nr:uncharacterized protein GLRG_09600 [Colletotrichum graminicola M1.001]EFQ34456.1 hypothetical protein GLRG_09600 [Colletotrichum graminicola M1.001]